MKKLIPVILACSPFPSFSILNAQKVELQLSPKPAITVNGNNCSILNTIWSCVTRVCDSVVIVAGDSIEFCTSTEVFLNTDTAYWIEWNFPGSANYPDSVYHHYPYQTPHCIYPRWDVPGDYYCDIYYNGWLSAYPNSDCYSFGPSHWVVHVQVDPNPNGVQYVLNPGLKIMPNPTTGIISTGREMEEIIVMDVSGRIIISKQHTEEVDISACDAGIYMVLVRSCGMIIVKKVQKI